MTNLYHPDIFRSRDLTQAKGTILTDEGPGADTDTRWAAETPYVLNLLRQALAPRPGMIVLDYGCGVGRLAKGLIETTGCSVIGVDLDASMRGLAHDYVGSDLFTAVSPAQFDELQRHGLRCDAALAVWVLQHCFEPAADIRRIRAGLAPGGLFFVLNLAARAVPAMLEADTPAARFAWVSDGVDVEGLLRTEFEVLADAPFDNTGLPNIGDHGARIMRLRQG